MESVSHSQPVSVVKDSNPYLQFISQVVVECKKIIIVNFEILLTLNYEFILCNSIEIYLSHFLQMAKKKKLMDIISKKVKAW